MFLRKLWREKDGKRHQYWALAETYRTARGPRQRIVAWLGELSESRAASWKRVAKELDGEAEDPPGLFDDDGSEAPARIQVDTRRVRIERVRDFGDAYLAWELWRKLELDRLLERLMPSGREEVAWKDVAALLVMARFCEPSSELKIETSWYGRSSGEDLLGIAADQVNVDRLYRGLDHLLPLKEALEKHLKERLGRLFEVKFDVLLYDVTSTYFEGLCAANPMAQRGHSRDQRYDCKQVCIALVVTTEGLPLGYEVFDGNRVDVTTVEDIVEAIEKKYGQANRIWVMDRGMVSEDNLEYLRDRNALYLVGTPRSMLRRFERDLVDQGWEEVQSGVEVKLCPGPEGLETFVLCRSVDRKAKEEAMHRRFAERIEKRLEKMRSRIEASRRRLDVRNLERQIGRILERNSRAGGAFQVGIQEDASLRGGVKLAWTRRPEWARWAALSEGCYLLRTNLVGKDPRELWKTYTQLTDAEEAFRSMKTDLSIRPIYHQTENRVKAHILVAFLAYVLRRTLAEWMRGSGLGNAPQPVIDEIRRVKSLDVVLPTEAGRNVRLRCVSTPEASLKILLDHLGLKLPRRLRPLPKPTSASAM
jgi:transposase